MLNLQWPLERFYDRLTRSDAPRPADLIFVHAGRMERKPYGMSLYRAGLAPRLLLSIGRFEVSRMRSMGFEGAEELAALRDRTAPDERHFFCEVDSGGMRIVRAGLRRWSTYGEVMALREFLAGGMPRSILVVSTDVHLRRVALVFAKVFQGAPLEVHYCAVPPPWRTFAREAWWRNPEGRRAVIKEAVKLAAYRAILKLPEGPRNRLMRLKR